MPIVVMTGHGVLTVRFPTLHEAHHLRVVSAIRVLLGNEYGFRRPNLLKKMKKENEKH